MKIYNLRNYIAISTNIENIASAGVELSSDVYKYIIFGKCHMVFTESSQ